MSGQPRHMHPNERFELTWESPLLVLEHGIECLVALRVGSGRVQSGTVYLPVANRSPSYVTPFGLSGATLNHVKGQKPGITFYH